MPQIPCRQCDGCGMYHDMSVVICDQCGKDISSCSVVLVDVDEIPQEKVGNIDRNKTFYIQKCPRCNTLNFLIDPNTPVNVCSKCHKTMISSITPKKYEDEILQPDMTVEDGDCSEPTSDPNTEAWKKRLSNVQKASERIYDESEVPVWSDCFEEDYLMENERESKAKHFIKLTEIHYGKISFTVTADSDTNYMLGRSANQQEFFRDDLQIGNEHCLLFIKNGSWYVRDNHSGNGTLVNSKDIGYNGECELREGDELKLGHRSDSITFHVSIK